MKKNNLDRPHQRYFTDGRKAPKDSPAPAIRQETAPKSMLPTAKKVKKRALPILEIVVVLLLIKVGITAFLYNDNNENPSEQEQLFSVKTAEASSPVLLNNTISGSAAIPAAGLISAAPMMESVAAAQLPVSGMAAGAAIVLSGQAAAGTGTIPLPPDSGDLLKPASQLNLPSPVAPISPASTDATSAGSAAQNQAGKVNASQIQEIQAREMEIARKQADLEIKENAMFELEDEINKKLKALDDSKANIEASVKRNEALVAEQKALREEQQKEDKKLKNARIEHLVTAYKSMKPEQAGNLVNSMDDDIAVAILSAMPGRSAGAILAMVEPGKAARLTKAISEKRIDPNILLEEANNLPQ